MYRFLIDGNEWILRFIPQASSKIDKKEIILKSLCQIGSHLSLLSHGESFLIMNRNIGAVIIKVEKIPSNIVTVSNVIAKDNWYLHVD